MASQSMRKETNSNAGNTEFLSNATLHEAALSKLDMESVMNNTQSCMDQSILAMFADTSSSSENKSGMDEENDSTLLTALTEILDRGENSEGTLSPFDTLPDTELLINQEHGEHSTLRKLLSLAADKPTRDIVYSSSTSLGPLAFSTVKEGCVADRLRRSRLRGRIAASALPSDGEDEAKRKGRALGQPRRMPLRPTWSLEAAEAEIEVFTSTSLVHLVRLMHPYSLRVRLEERGKCWSSSPNHTASSPGEQSPGDPLSFPGEILKYEKPSGDSDEEVNVDVSDEEATEVASGHAGRGEGELKSVLVGRDASKTQPRRQKKRVSFGCVEVARFDALEHEEPEQNEPGREHWEQASETAVSRSHSGADACDARAVTVPALAKPASGSDGAPPPQSKTKPKSLSLQEYRQLRHKRLPLAEQQRNNAAKWPRLPTTPTELSPIMCVQGVPRYSDCLSRAKRPGHNISSSRGSGSVEAKHTVRRGGLKRARTESTAVSPARPLVDRAAHPQSRPSPAKKLALINSDPPNPVLLPLPVAHLSRDRSMPLKVPPMTRCSPEPKPKVAVCNRASPLKNTGLLQEIQKNACKQQLLKIEPPSPDSTSKVLIQQQCPETESIRQRRHIRRAGVSEQPLKAEPVSLHSKPLEACQTATWTKHLKESSGPLHQQCGQSPTGEIKPLPNVTMSSSPAQTKQAHCVPSTQLSTIVNTDAPAGERSTGASLVISAPEELPLCLQATCSIQTPKVDKGIEATDLTSLLQRFEETQAIEKSHRQACDGDFICKPVDRSDMCGHPRPMERICNKELAAIMQTLDTTQQSQQLKTDREPCESQKAEPGQSLKHIVDSVKISCQESFSTEVLETQKQLVLHPCQISESAAIPEPLGIDVILGTQDVDHFPSIPKRRNPEKPKVPASKAIQIINPRPLPPKKIHGSLSNPPVGSTSSQMHLLASVTSDHDYCVSEGGKNLKPPVEDVPDLTANAQAPTRVSSSPAVCETPPGTVAVTAGERGHQPPTKRVGSSSESKRPADRAVPAQRTGHAVEAEEGGEEPLSHSHPAGPERGRQKWSYRRRSPGSDLGSSSPSSSSSSSSSATSSSSPSSSRSHSPRRKRFRPRRSDSSAGSSSSRSRSPLHSYRLAYSRSRSSRSRSKSWSRSRSRSRSPSPRNNRRCWRDVYSPSCYRKGSTESSRRRRQHEMRIQKLKAIDERRVVYVGRIGSSMKHGELRERFSLFGEVECVSLHFRDRGDNYGFVTFYNMEDAFAAIENGSKLRRPDERPLDICFGGRRQFCKSTYADLDSNRDVESSPVNSKLEELDFDSLLKQAQKGIRKGS